MEQHPQPCPCTSSLNYEDCCEPYLNQQAIPETPESLMRARYTAYTLTNIEYIINTMRGQALAEADRNNAEQWSKNAEWLGLEILEAPIPTNNQGFVEFIASYKENGKVEKLHERSRFLRIDSYWYYVDGEYPKAATVTKPTKIGRNQPCPCESGKKYKKCCGV